MMKIQGAAFQKMCADIASSLKLGTPSFATAKEFLQGAGQGSIIQQVIVTIFINFIHRSGMS